MGHLSSAGFALAPNRRGSRHRAVVLLARTSYPPCSGFEPLQLGCGPVAKRSRLPGDGKAALANHLGSSITVRVLPRGNQCAVHGVHAGGSLFGRVRICRIGGAAFASMA